jgi:hypothetical protein
VVAVLALVAVFGVPSEAPAATVRSTFTHGFDLSWPQCHGRSIGHMPVGQPTYVILGLTHGSGHTVNPCLRAQLHWAHLRRAKVGGYLVASYPTHRQRIRSGAGHCKGRLMCQLHRDGARQVRDALATLHRVHMRSPMVWLDVEFRHQQPWTHANLRNRAVVQGMVRELRRRHKRFGVYTTGLMWRDLLGHYRLDVPQWLPSGHRLARLTKPMCRRTATGGQTWLVQYTLGLDQDLTCPVLDATRDHALGSGHGFLLSKIVAHI